MKNKLLSILLYPGFIALVISLVIIYFLPDYFTKYKVELVNNEYIGRDCRIYYQDLNNDNYSEKIVSYYNSLGNAGFEIHSSSDELIDQWNFSNKHSSPLKNLWFFDANSNGYKEIYLFTQKRDSLFLNIEEPFLKNGIHKKNILVDIINNHNNEFKINSTIFGAYDVNENSEKEVIFILDRGYSGNPRNIYKYNLTENKIYKSLHLTNHSTISQIIDLDNDGSKEIFLKNYSAGNTIDSIYTTRSDYSSWFTVLNQDLTFRFEPIEIKSKFSIIQTIPFKSENEYEILILINSQQSKYPDKLRVYSNLGVLIKEKELSSGYYNIFLDTNKNEFILLNTEKGHIQTYNYSLNEVASVFIEPQSTIFNIDFDKNGETEWLIKSADLKKVAIYRNGFMDPVEFQFPDNSKDQFYFGLKQIGEKESEIYFQKGNYHYIYKYGENPLYIFRYLIYIGVFLLIFSLVWLARKGQKIQMEKQRAIEDQISKLQIKTIKNQVDPHFVFNAVNTISEMMLTDNKLEADRFISKFSKLMRETLQKSDKISTTLQEEMDYVENYIQLQQIRFNNSFNYKIKKDISIDYQALVPKHVLYSYVENAIKHGLSSKLKDGLLTISTNLQHDQMILTVEDNGGGIDKSKNSIKNSTGNGFRIMEEMYKLYKKLYNKKIKHKSVELFDKDGKKAGVRVEVIISK